MATKATHSPTSTLTVEQAAAAIVEMINGRPASPRQDEIEAIIARTVGPAPLVSLSDDQAGLRAAIHECVEAEKALNEAGEKTISELPREAFEAADRRFTLALERVDELAAHLPNPPRSIGDVVLRAQVAFCHADKDPNGRLAALSKEKVGDDEVANARLIEAVLQFAAIDLD